MPHPAVQRGDHHAGLRPVGGVSDEFSASASGAQPAAQQPAPLDAQGLR